MPESHTLPWREGWSSPRAGERSRYLEGRGAWGGRIHCEKTATVAKMSIVWNRTWCCPQRWKEEKKMSSWEMSLCVGVSQSTRIYHWQREVISTAVGENQLTRPPPTKRPLPPPTPPGYGMCVMSAHIWWILQTSRVTTTRLLGDSAA